MTDANLQARTTTVVHWSGDLDLANVFPAGADLLTAVAAPGTNMVVLDLGAVEFMDSTAIGAMLSARNAALANGVTLVVRNASARTMKLFDITGIGTLLTFS